MNNKNEQMVCFIVDMTMNKMSWRGKKDNEKGNDVKECEQIQK